MRSTFRHLFLLTCLWAGLATSGHAAAIFGQLAVMGKAKLDGPLGTATAITLFEKVRVGFGTGDYDISGLIPVNTPVAFAPLALDAPLEAPVELWKFISGNCEYTFELHEFSLERFEFADNLFMNLSGSGFASIDGVRKTAARFSFSTQQCTDSPDTVITWSAETIAASVPEGGTSWILLFLGIIGIETSRRMFHNFRRLPS